MRLCLAYLRLTNSVLCKEPPFCLVFPTLSTRDSRRHSTSCALEARPDTGVKSEECIHSHTFVSGRHKLGFTSSRSPVSCGASDTLQSPNAAGPKGALPPFPNLCHDNRAVVFFDLASSAGADGAAASNYFMVHPCAMRLVVFVGITEGVWAFDIVVGLRGRGPGPTESLAGHDFTADGGFITLRPARDDD